MILCTVISFHLWKRCPCVDGYFDQLRIREHVVLTCRNTQRTMTIGKKLSFLLRHGHDQGVTFSAPDARARADDAARWLMDNGHDGDHEAVLSDIENEVRDDSKQRFDMFDQDGVRWIRAVQGHSSGMSPDMSLGMTVGAETVTHDTLHKHRCSRVLFHATTDGNVAAIIASGAISPVKRGYVHWAQDVGGTRDRKCVIVTYVGDLLDAGVEVFVAKNGVVNTSSVPINMIAFIHRRRTLARQLCVDVDQNKFPCVGVILFDGGGRVLVVKEHGGKIGFPKGGVERKDKQYMFSRIATALRETNEEAGVLPFEVNLSGHSVFELSRNDNPAVQYFIATLSGRSPDVLRSRDGDSVESAEFMRIRDVLASDMMLPRRKNVLTAATNMADRCPIAHI